MIIKIIDTNNLENETPQYKTWFRLHNDVIFISVIYPKSASQRSHFRRKSKPNTNQNKKDNEMCLWHSDWQFSKIEKEYGLAKNGNKTYEINIKFNDETHRIDSVVNNLAIEFQHTLTVSINEIESRYIAHKALGFTPYLILDFTEYLAKDTILKISKFNYKDLSEYINVSNKEKETYLVLKKIKKWLNSHYFKNKNLFLDFNDSIIRFVPNEINTFYEYKKEFFLENLLQLEEILIESQENIKRIIAKRKEKVELRFQYFKEQERVEKVEKNKKDIIDSNQYHYYRKCILNKHIKKAIFITLGEPSFVSYSFKSGEYYGNHRNVHIYRLFSKLEDKPKLEIQYAVIGTYENKKYSFLFSEIEIIKKIGENNMGFKIMRLSQKPKQSLKLVSITEEIVKNYFHSLKNYAKILYDDNEKVKNKEYYIFNTKVSKQILNELNEYYEMNGNSENLNDEAKKTLSKIDLEDRYINYDLKNNIIQNYIPEKKLYKFYNDYEEIMPFYDDEFE